MSVCWWREDHAEREKLGERRGGVGEGWGEHQHWFVSVCWWREDQRERN